MKNDTINQEVAFSLIWNMSKSRNAKNTTKIVAGTN